MGTLPRYQRRVVRKDRLQPLKPLACPGPSFRFLPTTTPAGSLRSGAFPTRREPGKPGSGESATASPLPPKIRIRICLVAVDVQNTFCIPGYELFVGGASGRAAVEDNRRLCRFIYRNLGVITRISPTLDTHRPVQIFHPLFLIDEAGEHPEPYTVISAGDVRRGIWRINPVACSQIGMDRETGQAHLLHYVSRLQAEGQYQLTVWPYHGMLGGIGHALVSSLEGGGLFSQRLPPEPARFPGQGETRR